MVTANTQIIEKTSCAFHVAVAYQQGRQRATVP